MINSVFTFFYFFNFLRLSDNEYPKYIAKYPITKNKLTLKKNNKYKPLFKILYKSKIHPLKVVRDPQKLKQRNNFIFFETLRLFINPKMKHPRIFTKKILLIFHRIKEPKIEPAEITKNSNI